MERRLFVKKTALMTTGVLALSGSNLYASTEEKKSNRIDLSPITASTNKIILKGSILDAITLKKIEASEIEVKVKRNRFFSIKEAIEKTNGSYHIISGFSGSKVREKLHIKINANGYKPYEGCLYVTQNGCHVHSEEWKYNPNFKPEFCPENTFFNNLTEVKFNFHLVKK